MNIEIVDLENQSDPLYKKQLEGKLRAKREELESLEKAKPLEVEKPGEETEEQRELSASIAKLNSFQKALEQLSQQTVEFTSQCKMRLQKLSSLLQTIMAVDTNVSGKKAELRPICEDLGLNVDAIINLEVQLTPINEQIELMKNKIIDFETDNKHSFHKDFVFSTLVSLPDQRAGQKYLSGQIETLKEKLSTPQRKYQNYLDKYAIWNAQRLDILGGENDPQADTVKYFESQISYIENKLYKQLSEKLNFRRAISENIFNSKKKILKFYSDLKTSVEEKLSAVRTDEFSVNIDASFVLDRSFFHEFLTHINKKRKGPFHGANDPEKVLKALLAEIDWNNFESMYGFFEVVLSSMTTYNEETLQIKQQVNDKKEFYHFLFSLGYFSAKYELRSGGKNLNELSPGEKGLLLLVFYLQLDKDNIPLVIDQPEDNLDNDSIFAVLAKCIREAKKNRQVILVTHNPNLAVGADAEQIIFVKLNKAENYRFSYETGAIENPSINDKIVLVLEGSQPAFIKRRLKYEI